MSSEPGPSPRQRRPLRRGEALGLAAAAALGALWGIAWQRTAALTDIAGVAPILLAVIGPGLLAVLLGLRIATGTFEVRPHGWAAALAVAAALAGNLLTPGLAPSVAVAGRLGGSLAGVALDGASGTTCLWGPGRTSVIRVTSSIPGAPPALPGGVLTIELPSGAVSVDPGSGGPVMPLRLGTGGIGDAATGSLSLDPAQGATVSGEISWACDPAPAR